MSRNLVSFSIAEALYPNLYDNSRLFNITEK